MKSPGKGSLVRLKIAGRARNIDGETFSLKVGEVGMIVATNLWPNASWENRSRFQLDGPYLQILFSEKVAIIPTTNLETRFFEVILEK